MNTLKKKLSIENIFEFGFFLAIGFFSTRPIENFDFWFHLKYGQYISQYHNLPFTDLFSHTAFGQPAIPYEWLFQVFIYQLYSIFGNPGVQAFVAFSIITYAFFFRQILKNIFKISILPRFFLTGALVLLNFEFFVERPQSAAFILYMATLFLVLKFAFEKKNYLFLTPFLILIWTNLHASMIIGIYLLLSFAVVVFVRNRKQSLPLFAFGLAGFGITLLPPLTTKVYELLLLFYQKHEFISKTIDEWVPLSKLQQRFLVYIAILTISVGSFASIIVLEIRKTKRFFDSPLILFLPLVPLSLFVITGIRQSPFSLPATFILLVPAIQSFKRNLSPKLTLITLLFISLCFGLILNLYRNSYPNLKKNYPSDNTISFIKSNLKGNMFNEFHIGGFLLYKLGPEFKTFIDGRTDMFLPEVLPEYVEFIGQTNNDDKSYLESFEKLAKKYNVSFVLLTTNRYTLSWRLSRILGESPNWQLVYFDDKSQIFIPKNSLNSSLLKKIDLSALTPNRKRLYLENQQAEAEKQYWLMNSISPSATALNAEGFIALEKNKFDQAKKLFQKALQINPDASAPKMNLAELSAKDGDLQTAIDLYQKAIEDDPERGLAYLRLGDLILQSTKDPNKAKKIWTEGTKSTPDSEILKALNKRLGNN